MACNIGSITMVVEAFRKLGRGDKYRTDKAAEIKGAKIFIQKFGGLFRMKKRSEIETLDFLIEHDFADNYDSAGKVLNQLKEKRIYFGNKLFTDMDESLSCRYFRLDELVNSEGDKKYKIKTWAVSR